MRRTRARPWRWRASPRPNGLSHTGLKGSVDVSVKGNEVVLATNALKAGAATLKGRVALDNSESINSLEANIEADRISVAGLLGWITDADAKAPEIAEDVAAGVWPQAQFSFGALGRRKGTVALKTASLELTETLVARDAVLAMALAPDEIKIERFEAQGADGALSLKAALTKTPAGAALEGTMSMDVGLAALSPAASGRASFDVTASGRAASPAGLINALAGQGSIKFKSAEHPGPSPALVADASDAVLAGKLANDAAVLAPALAAALDSARLVTGTRSVPFTISNGNVKVESFAVDGAQGNARVTATISLASLMIDAAWQVAATASPLPVPAELAADLKPVAKGPLPPVTFVYTGPLGDTPGLNIAVDAVDLQRELVVRQMERKVEELELLRKRDEERQRQEGERRKALEAERAAAAAAAAAARAAAQKPAEPDVEQLPPVIPQSAADGEAVSTVPADASAGDSATALPGQSPGAARDAPQPVPRATAAPRPRPQRPRTTSDELNRAFGGWP